MLTTLVLFLVIFLQFLHLWTFWMHLVIKPHSLYCFCFLLITLSFSFCLHLFIFFCWYYLIISHLIAVNSLMKWPDYGNFYSKFFKLNQNTWHIPFYVPPNGFIRFSKWKRLTRSSPTFYEVWFSLEFQAYFKFWNQFKKGQTTLEWNAIHFYSLATVWFWDQLFYYIRVIFGQTLKILVKFFSKLNFHLLDSLLEIFLC